MGIPLRVLFVEDVEDDYLLVRRELMRGGFDLSSERAETPEEIESALRRGPWDLVMSDFSLPRLDGMAALSIVQRCDPDLPVIIVSGTIGEDAAVAALQQGARDFMLKTNLARMIPSVVRALDNARARREQRAMEEALRESEERLRQAQKLDSIGRLAGGIAHDFNNVLSVIRTLADFLVADIADGTARVEDAVEIREAGDRASRLVSQLLTFSGRRMLEPRALDLNALVAGMDSMLRRLIPENVTITTELAASLPSVVADQAQLEQVIVNLVVNARDAMPDGGTLRIETRIVEDDDAADGSRPVGGRRRVALTVADTGVGMSAEVRRHIFEPFYTTKEPGRGTGLGLSTVYGIVQQAGGEIHLRTAPGKGTTCDVLLPECRSTPEEHADEQSIGSAEGTETVLLVDDEVPVRAVARRILQQAGYTVLEAADCDEASALARRESANIDLLLTDLVMPGMGGHELAAVVCMHAPHAAVVFMSGYSEDETRAPMSAAARRTFLAKPFDRTSLLQVVRRALDARSGRNPAMPA